MKPIKFTQADIKFIAEGCHDLPVCRGDGEFISCWELDGDDNSTNKTCLASYYVKCASSC